jgi:hypothetical protein
VPCSLERCLHAVKRESITADGVLASFDEWMNEQEAKAKTKEAKQQEKFQKKTKANIAWTSRKPRRSLLDGRTSLIGKYPRLRKRQPRPSLQLAARKDPREPMLQKKVEKVPLRWLLLGLENLRNLNRQNGSLTN